MSVDTAPHVVVDLLGLVQILSDGSVLRGDESVLGPKEPFPDVPGVQWKDVLYHPARGLRVRVYRSPSAVSGGGKLPVLVYFHGGGYCLGSFAQPTFHAFCLRAAAELPAVVLSMQYRLAPEHRLPAALDDGAAFLSWLRGQAELGAGADPWLAESACFARTFLSGVSAGANLSHHLIVQVASARLAVSPVQIVGYVLLSAFFTGSERTAAEANLPADVFLPVELSDQLWHMSLPVGATRDHPVANSFRPESPSLAPVELPPALVVAPLDDVLRDRSLGYAARLKDMGKDVELVEFEGQQHGFSVLRALWRGGRRVDASPHAVRVLSWFCHGRCPRERI